MIGDGDAQLRTVQVEMRADARMRSFVVTVNPDQLRAIAMSSLVEAIRPAGELP